MGGVCQSTQEPDEFELRQKKRINLGLFLFAPLLVFAVDIPLYVCLSLLLPIFYILYLLGSYYSVHFQRMAFLLSKLVRNIVIIYIIFSGIQWGLRSKSYTISPKEFKNIAAKVQGLIFEENDCLLLNLGPIQSAVSSITNDLRRLYGSAISSDSPWTSLILGGHDFRALFLHASLTEYAAIFGTPFASNGRIGNYYES